jgi:hypothetical protein
MMPLLAATRSSRRCCSGTVLKWHMRPKGTMMLTLPAHGMPFQDASLNETDMGGTPRGTPVRSPDCFSAVVSRETRDRAISRAATLFATDAD